MSRRGFLAAGGQAAAMLVTAGGCCQLLDEETDQEREQSDGDAAASPPPGPPTPISLRPPESEPLVRVRIAARPANETLRFGELGDTLTFGETASNAADADVGRPLAAPVTLRRSDRGWTWRDAEDRRGELVGADDDGPTPIEIGRPLPDFGIQSLGGPPPLDPAGVVRWSGTRWPGRLRLVCGATTTHILAVLPMETYLPSVLDGELIGGWHDATCEAQAIAARSFATFQALVRRDRPWDVESDERSQMFEGATELTRALEAGATTAGRLLTYGDRVIPAYYSSTCGGRGMPASLAIGPDPANDIPPLAGHTLGDCCTAAPRSRWTARRSLARVREQLDRWGRGDGPDELAGLGRVTGIGIAERATTGRPSVFEITHGSDDDPATVRITGPQLRRGLQSRRDAGEDPVWSGDLEPSVDVARGSVRFRGRGWGHGAGLCQYGAQSMAASGRTATQILAAYFPGAAITPAWPGSSA